MGKEGFLGKPAEGQGCTGGRRLVHVDSVLLPAPVGHTPSSPLLGPQPAEGDHGSGWSWRPEGPPR